MCVICAGVGSARPDRSELVEACKSNPDGFSWGAVVEVGDVRQLVSGRSMDSVEAIDSYFQLHELFEVLASFFHARISTHGSNRLENCHGFEVGGSGGQSIIAHNGILPIKSVDDKTDSEIFAEEILGGLFGGIPALDSPHVWDVLEGYVESSGSKVVILTIEDEMPLLILGEGLGHWQTDDLWWSNKSYKAPVLASWSTSAWGYEYDSFRYSTPKKDDMATWWLCDNPDCGARVADGESNCEFCGWCLDCLSAFDECMCLTVGGER